MVKEQPALPRDESAGQEPTREEMIAEIESEIAAQTSPHHRWTNVCMPIKTLRAIARALAQPAPTDAGELREKLVERAAHVVNDAMLEAWLEGGAKDGEPAGDRITYYASKIADSLLTLLPLPQADHCANGCEGAVAENKEVEVWMGTFGSVSLTKRKFSEPRCSICGAAWAASGGEK